jgi:hypothetical protein
MDLMLYFFLFWPMLLPLFSIMYYFFCLHTFRRRWHFDIDRDNIKPGSQEQGYNQVSTNLLVTCSVRRDHALLVVWTR